MNTTEVSHEQELKRLEALREYDILDSLPEKEFDALTKLAAEICGTPVSMINLIDEHRQWSKSIVGMDENAREVPRSSSVCQYAVLDHEQLEIPDMSKDDRFSQAPYVVDDPKLRYYLGSPLITPDGYATGSLCVIDYKKRDLTAKQKSQLKIIADEVMARLELRKQNNQLKSLNEYKTKLMKMLSHDMRSPLNGIMGMASLMKEMAGDEATEESEMLDIIEQSSFQLNQMIDEIMSYTLIESDGFSINLSDVNLSRIAEGLKKLYLPAAKTKQIDLDFYTENITDEVQIDGDKFEQIFGNLLSNAIKFTKTGGKVTAVLKKVENSSKNYIELSVRDNGIGMSDEQVNSLFISKSNSHKKGTDGEKSTGLGLSIIKYFVELHEGTIHVESEVGEGTVFTIKIPVQ